jgi:hypothetical protein
MKMKRLTYTIFFTLLTLIVYCQDRLVDQINNLEGIWIAEDYLKSFKKTKSSVQSIIAFNPDDPAGLRINKLEITDGYLNIGYSVLHDHTIHPEISKYEVVESDTINEQGHFKINIVKSDSLNFYETSQIYYFNDECKAYFSWIYSPDTLLILYRPGTEKEAEKTIRFERISHSIKPNYPFPNPIYYYTRCETLVGTYTLKDSLNKVISNDFRIDFDGKTKGYAPFSDKLFYFSTDIYCGPEITKDYIILCSFRDKSENDFIGYIYKRVDEITIQFHQSEWIETAEGLEQIEGKMIYKLTKK